MKRYMFAAIVTLLGCFGAKAEELSSFIVNTTDGGQIEFKFAASPEMTFDGEDLVIADASEQTVRYPMADVENVVFAKYTSSLRGVDSDRISVTVTRSYIDVTGLEAGADVRVYDIDGVGVASGRADADGSLRLGVADLAKGVYIVAMPGRNFKFIR